ncbi:MAG TPA: hypothetical protein VGF45_11260 [Polyangia bacterium]
MSTSHSSKAAAAGGPSDSAPLTGEEGMNILKIVVVGVVSLVIFAVSAVIAALVLSADEEALNVKGLAPIPADIMKKEELGIIDMVPFDADHRLQNWQAEKHKALTSWGWVDKSKGVVRMPIEDAMKDVIQKGGAGEGNK